MFDIYLRAVDAEQSGLQGCKNYFRSVGFCPAGYCTLKGRLANLVLCEYSGDIQRIGYPVIKLNGGRR